MYCIYSNTNVPDLESNPEHIFPLSLGGRNDFTLKVSIEFNALVNSEIDERLARCFFLATNRHQHNSRGHRNKQVRAPKPTITLKNDIPISLRFDSSGLLELFNPRTSNPFDINTLQSNGMKMGIKFYPFLRLRFAAKVALASSYLVFGENFKNSIAARDLRTLMHLHGKKHNQTNLDILQSNVWFWPNEYPQDGKEMTIMLVEIAKYLNCSFIAIISNIKENHVLFAVGVLGELVGCIFSPFESKNIPKHKDYDLGHIIILEKEKTRRVSIREVLQEICNVLNASQATPT